MAKEPYKDPFENLPRRVCGVVVDSPTPTKAEKRAVAKEAQREAEKATKKRGPKKGVGGRPKKDGDVSRTTKWRRKAKD